jgi:PPK2 family polyphosphate:nucleotide phosphotransferase
VKHYYVKPREHLKLRDRDPGDTGDYSSAGETVERTEHLKQEIDALQERLYAEGSRALLVVLQGIDTSGKDGTIRSVMSGVNPEACIVTSFKAPTPAEKAHDFLWRIHTACPPHGYIGIFNRSHYEDVLVTRVHGWITDEEAEHRLEEIRDFERLLARSGTRIVKFLLHISKAEQKKRLLARIDRADKHWKLSPDDLKERKFWKEYQKAFEQALSKTSTKEAPWVIVPADHHWYRNLVVAECIARALHEMDPKPPKVRGIDWSAMRRELSRE